MQWQYWAAIGLTAVLYISLYRSGFFRFSKEPQFNDILYQRGDVAYVSPTAIMRAPLPKFDPERVKEDNVDRLVRLRMVEVAQSLLDPASNIKDEEDRKQLRRYATVQSAILGLSIPKSFILIDKETKHLFMSVLSRLELVSVERVPVGSDKVDDTHELAWINVDMHNAILERERKALLAQYSSVDHLVQQEFLRQMGRNEYDYFHMFATRCRRRFSPQQKQKVDDAGIKSVITAYAARTGLKIPRSYVSYDPISVLLMNWDDLPKPEAQVYDFRKGANVPRCECGNMMGLMYTGLVCDACDTSVMPPMEGFKPVPAIWQSYPKAEGKNG
jgi:hypothetical protein